MNVNKLKASVAALACLATLSACGNEGPDEAGGPLAVAAKTALGAIAARRPDNSATAPVRTPQQRAAEAIRVNPGPLILAGFESLGQTPIMALTGQNGAMRTYMTSAEEALILRNGMLIGTRGLGSDLSVAEPQTEALIRADRTGQARRVMRYYAGDGRERPLAFDCQVGPGPKPGVTVEDCRGHGIAFQNSYMVQGGQIPVSRQWIGPGLGYVTIQVLRP